MYSIKIPVSLMSLPVSYNTNYSKFTYFCLFLSHCQKWACFFCLFVFLHMIKIPVLFYLFFFLNFYFTNKVSVSNTMCPLCSYSFQSYVFFLFVFVLFYFIFKLYITVLVLPNIKMNPPQVYMCSPS